MTKSIDELERGRTCYERGEWNEAYEALARADCETALEAADLERLAWSAALTGRDTEMLAVFERQYQALADAGDGPGAARAAFWLGFRLLSLGEAGRAGGWLARARRLVDCENGNCVIEGYLLLPEIYRHLATGDLDAARDCAARAVDIGLRFGNPDLVALGRNLQGRALMQQGRVADGLTLADEAMLAATAGDLSPLVTGLVYCTVIASCQQVYALDRSREWTAALADWCDRQPQLVTFTGSCLVHRAEVMQLGGAWREAIEEAQRAAERFADTVATEAVADAYYQQAEVHRLRGESDAAEEAYGRASRFGREPQPGLALLRLAEGQHDAALRAIQRVVGATPAALSRARLLPAFVEIALAAGQVDEARGAADELSEIAERFGTDVLCAMAAHARGAVLLADGDAQGAVEPLRRAFEVWRQVGAPYIGARIRVLLSRACDALGDRDGARLERDAARRVFEELGAAPALAAMDGLGEETVRNEGHGLTPRELEVLRLVATGKTNKAIGRELFVSEKTVDRHVSNIFTKLDVSSRAAATAYAYEHGLV